MTVAMALAEQLHHSVKIVERDDVLRRQTTRASAEEEVHELYDGLGAQKRPPLGVRPGILAEPRQQRSDRSLRRSSQETPLLGVPSLADASDEAVDGHTLRCLLEKNLSLKEEEAEERRSVEAQQKEEYDERRMKDINRRIANGVPCSEVEMENWRRYTVSSSSSAGKRRKRKKRRKRRLPRVPRSVVDVPVVMQPVFQPFKCEMVKVPPQLQFLDRVLDISVMPQRRTLCSSWYGCHAPVGVQRQVPWWSSFL